MGPTCLIVDDEQSICVLIHDFLVEKGFQVIATHTKADAFLLIEEREFDLVLVDKNLPDGSGMEVVAELRRLGRASEIIVITGYSDLESAIEAVSFGVFRYIKKPFDLNLLAAETEGALETRTVKRNLIDRTAELEQANADLMESERRFRHLADLLPGIVVEADEHGKLTFANRTGLTCLELDFDRLSDGFLTGDIFSDECRQAWRDYVLKAIHGDTMDLVEFEMVKSDGTKMPVLAQADSLFEGGKRKGYRALFLDITSRKAAEAALRAKETELQLAQKMEAVGALAGGVAHDFNNMLGVIRGFTDVVILELHAKDPVQEDLRGIIEAVDRAADLTRRLLAFGRKQILIPQTINLNSVVQGMEKMFTRLLPETIAFEAHLCAFPLNIFADKGQIEQIILNLVVNAKDAMPEGGTLILETETVDSAEHGKGAARLSVIDTGVGMDEAVLSRIFEPFFTTKQPGKGTGLGLAAVFGIVKQSGGRIAVESKPGKGARFNLEFPLTEGTLHKPSTLPPGAAMLRGTETVLVVEDEAMLLQVVARLLRNYGYTVLTAPQPGDALLQCEKHTAPIDLLLVDVVMPRMNGSELAQRLRIIHPEMRVLYMSGYSDFTVVRQVMSENLDCFIAKPFCGEDLAAKVREVITRSVSIPAKPVCG